MVSFLLTPDRGKRKACMELAFLTLLAYLVGSFPTGVVLSRIKYGIDVREMGSGNIGATNITRTFGWYAGVLTLVIDCLKGFLPVFLVARFFPGDPRLVAAVGIAVVAGHCFSAYLKFRGGKGVATSLGCLAAAEPWLALSAALTYAIVLGVSRISAVGSLAGILAANGYLALKRPPREVVWLTAGISVLVVLRHHSNIKRLLSGSKAKKEKS
jgi:acyl phosphate:glycerol-3-phosphate acyltransferase